MNIEIHTLQVRGTVTQVRFNDPCTFIKVRDTKKLLTQLKDI